MAFNIHIKETMSSNTEIDQVLSKIKDLMRLASNAGATEHEAKAATFAAEKLIAKHRISQQMLTIEVESACADEGYVYETGRNTMWKYVLLSTIAKHYGCVNLTNHDRSGKRLITRYSLFGLKEDIKIVRSMFTWLESLVISLTKTNAYGKGHVYVHSYSDGIVDGICQQLRKAKEEISEEFKSETVALAKIDMRAEDALKKLNSFCKTRSISITSHARRNEVAHARGFEQGKNIHLGKSLT